jgi:hypothetical protein
MNPLFLVGALLAASAPVSDTETLHPGLPAEIYTAPGRATTVLFHTAEKIAAISLASPVITYKYDRALNQLEITPAVLRGGVETNLNLRIGASVYILIVKVVEDVRAQYLREFTLAGEPGADDETALDRARPIAPADLDLIGAAKTVERAEADPVFRQAHPNLRIEPIGREFPWNGCRIELVEAAQFLEADLLLFRLHWVNRTPDALYLDPTQYGLTAGGRKIPVTARYHLGTGPIIAPGQSETVYLAVQGYRLSRHNDWSVLLPPDAAAMAGLGARSILP